MPPRTPRKDSVPKASGSSNHHPLFTIRFTEGLATRNRLPLDHVIRVLTEIKGMLETVGKQIQRERGAENPTGDFGLELVGGFQKGSVKAALAITKDVDAGVIAAMQVLDTVTRLGTFKKKLPSRQKTPQPVIPRSDYDPRLVTRLGNIGKVQEIDKTRVEMALRSNGGRPAKAVFDRRTSQVLTTLREPNFSLDDVTVYGKLFELRDRVEEGEEEKKRFFGELQGDDGNIWRVEFKPSDQHKAVELFRRRVFVNGNATHYKALNPKLVAADFGPDEERNYAAAFDELYGADAALAGQKLATLIEELETE